MKFEEALKAMREGKKVIYADEIYWVDDENKLVRYEYDFIDGYLDTSVIHNANLFGADIMSEDWEIFTGDEDDQVVGELWSI